MQALKTIAREAFGLFVADARFTLALIGWIAIAGAIPVLLEIAHMRGHSSSSPGLPLFCWKI